RTTRRFRENSMIGRFTFGSGSRSTGIANAPAAQNLVKDIAPERRATIRQKQTEWPVRLEMTEPARDALDAYIHLFSTTPGAFLFAGRTESPPYMAQSSGPLHSASVPGNGARSAKNSGCFSSTRLNTVSS